MALQKGPFYVVMVNKTIYIDGVKPEIIDGKWVFDEPIIISGDSADSLNELLCLEESEVKDFILLDLNAKP